MKPFILCLLLVGALAQTDFKNTCQNVSLIPKLATGLINLNPLDTYNNGANKDYYQDLTLNKFDTTDVLGHGFALTGFQAPCTNKFFTLIISAVSFENGNTRMRVVVDFRNPADQTITLWNMVSFTYIVVSRTLNGAYSNIWATVAELDNPADRVVASIDKIGASYQASPTAPPATCQVFVDPDASYDPTSCVPTAVVSADGATGGDQVIHAYIMGFRYNPAQSTTRYLAAGVLPSFGSLNPTTH
jgi:hypothetical protein